MFPRRPGRIQGFDYVGFHRYSVTICTHSRQSIFVDRAAIESVLTSIRQCAAASRFAVLAYCFMPDHLHLLVAGGEEHADFQRFMATWKQRAGYRHKQRTRQALWQESYYDHVLRDDEEVMRAVRYVLENPVRKGLARRFDEYPFSGSDVYSNEQLREFWQGRQG